jgi:hypothetical protein
LRDDLLREELGLLIGIEAPPEVLAIADEV